MKFIVKRNHLLDSERPCDDAVLEKYMRIDRRTTNDPAKVPAYGGKTGWWYNTGVNHRIDNGRITREIEDEAWFLDIDQVPYFSHLAQLYGPITIASFYNAPEHVIITLNSEAY